MKLSKKAFDCIVKRSIKRIPREIGCHLDNLLISVLWRPSPDMIEEMGLEPMNPFWAFTRAFRRIGHGCQAYTVDNKATYISQV